MRKQQEEIHDNLAAIYIRVERIKADVNLALAEGSDVEVHQALVREQMRLCEQMQHLIGEVGVVAAWVRTVDAKR